MDIICKMELNGGQTINKTKYTSTKYKLWKHLDVKDLQDDNGSYYKMTYDQAIMLPLLEMAGNRSKYINDIMHVYNKQNPLSVDNIKAQEQHQLMLDIRNKKSYSRLKRI